MLVCEQSNITLIQFYYNRTSLLLFDNVQVVALHSASRTYRDFLRDYIAFRITLHWFHQRNQISPVRVIYFAHQKYQITFVKRIK